MDKKQLQQILIILPVILIGGTFAFIQYLILPLNQQKKVLAEELEKIKKEYNESVGRVARLAKLQQEIELLNQAIAELQKKLPASKDLPGLIRMLSKKMNQHRISWSKLEPKVKLEKEHYIEHSFTIPFKGSYHDLALFLSDIGQMERIFATRFTSLKTEIETASGLVQVAGDLTFLIYTSKG